MSRSPPRTTIRVIPGLPFLWWAIGTTMLCSTQIRIGQRHDAGVLRVRPNAHRIRAPKVAKILKGG
jgi:hypothetical protein